eukprot:12921835-Prorocentrum_lima.AAC.1
MWNPPEEKECITFGERSLPSEYPDSLMEKFPEHDTQGDAEWQKFYLGVQTEKEGNCPVDEPIIIDCVKPDDIKINH